METSLPPLIRALLEPQRYPGRVRVVELVQTHISWVLLAGEFAFKIKKPLKLPFLDYSTLALRKACCIEELRLNRRYAPGVYLGVQGIFNSAQDPHLEGPGLPIEYAVKMRRFDDDQRLDRVCLRGGLQAAHLSDLADTVAQFHSNAAVAPATSRFGSAAEIMAQARDNFDELSRLLHDAAQRAQLERLRVWTEAQFGHLADLFERRRKEGRVRECHGDLHLANLVLIDRKVTLFDCIEFNEDLRWIDVASEIAFTYVDLLAHGQPGLAIWFVNEVLSRNADYGAARALPFYAVYRALVRVKVAGIRSGQTAQDDGEVGTYLALAERLMARPPPRLIITHGVTGCGKTCATDHLLQSDLSAGTLRLRADVERKRLFGLPHTHKSGSAMESGIYSAEAHMRTYARLRELSAALLQAGWSVIVDAAFLRRADRASFRALALEAGAAFSILAPQASSEQLRQRIEARQAMGLDASEGTLAVLALHLRTIEPLSDDEQ